jgi:hypothetical protein
MTVAMMAVTVYFVGLVNLVEPCGTEGREVIVPLTAPSVSRKGMALDPHRADIVIHGLTGRQTDCETTLGGTWDSALSDCTLSSLSGQVVALTGSSEKFTRGARYVSIPRLVATCPRIGAIDRDYLTDPSKYALRMTITHGKLNACTNGNAWVTYLTTTATTLSIGGRPSVTLSADAYVKITNQSTLMPEGPSKAHFWWYYRMYTEADSCETVPTAPTTAELDPCPAPVGFHGASGDVGCSNSNYP